MLQKRLSLLCFVCAAFFANGQQINVNGTPYDVLSFDPNQDFGTFSVNAGELTLTGNAWKKVDFSYTLTEVSILKFDYRVDTDGRILGIGMDTNDKADRNHVFQLSGSATYGFQDYNNYVGPGWVTYEIPIGDFIQGDVANIVFVGDDNQDQQSSSFRNISVEEAPVPPRAPISLFVQSENGTLYLHWTDFSSNETSFRVERRSAGSSTFSSYSSVGADVERVLLDHEPSQYEYRVVAANNQGENASDVIAGLYEIQVNGTDYPVESFDPNQDFGSYTLSNGEITLVGNAWKKVSLPYSLTEVSVLTFDFKVQEDGRILGIGLDNNDKADQNHVFQLAGRATYGIQDFNNYTGTDWVSYSIPVGDYISGDVSNLVFVGDDNKALQSSSFRNISLEEAVLPPAAPSTLYVQSELGTLFLNWSDNSSNETGFRVERSPIGANSFTTYSSTGLDMTKISLDHDPRLYEYRVVAFNDEGEGVSDSTIGNYELSVNGVPYAVESFDTNQDFGSFFLENGELTLEGNSWKKVSFDYTLTEVSYISFEFKVQEEGRIQGIGMDMNDRADQNHVFQLAGRATFGIQDFKNYTGSDWVSYTIPVGQYFTGDAINIVFVGDDGRALQSCSFRNITVGEAEVPPAAPKDLFVQQEGADINLHWSDESSNEAGFRVERSPSGQNLFATYTSVGANISQVSLDHDPNLYDYRVVAFNNLGENVSLPIAGVYEISVNGENYGIESFDANQDDGSYALNNGELTLLGNSWKKISFDYTLTEVSFITFDFKVEEEGRIQGIGMDMNDRADQNHVFQLAGRATFGIQDFKTYSGSDWVTFTIPVGQYYTGDVVNIVFVGDHNNEIQSCSFRNISVGEADVAPASPSNLHVQELNGDLSLHWFDNSSNEQGFRVERSLQEQDLFSLYATTNVDENSALLDHDPSIYDYRVVAFNAQGETASDTTAGFYQIQVNENQYAMASFDENQDEGSYELNNGELTLNGNSWKQVSFPYTLTAQSVISFEFKADVEGRIQGIGMDTNERADQNHVFQLAGRATYGFQDFKTYSGTDWVGYTIPIGQYITGDVINLVFVGDDNQALQSSSFRNIKIDFVPIMTVDGLILTIDGQSVTEGKSN